MTEETIENYAHVSESSMYGQDYMNLVKKWGAKECFVLQRKSHIITAFDETTATFKESLMTMFSNQMEK